MPNWAAVLEETRQEQQRCLKKSEEWKTKASNAITTIRLKHLQKLSDATGRNIISYYSGWLSKPGYGYITSINDEDMNGFMMTIHELDRDKGLDLFLHTPGGQLYATQAIVGYLDKMFDGNIRAFIPEIAMSAGTMIACCCSEIFMGKHSNLGPIDPQVGITGEPAEGIKEGFEQALKDIKDDPVRARVWEPILRKVPLSQLSQCEKAIDLSKSFVEKRLEENMFKGNDNPKKKAKKAVGELAKYGIHSEHFMIDKCKDEIGLKVTAIEEAKGINGQELQDLILTVHHCYMHLMMNSNCVKIIENQNGVAIIRNIKNQ